MKAAVRGVLLAPLTPEGARIVDIVILPIGAFVAFIVCIPIWVLSILAAAVVGSGLVAVGAPEEVRDVIGIVGIGGGLVLSFVALVRIYRRVQAGIRGWVALDDERPGPGAPASQSDFQSARKAPETETLDERIAAADSALAQGAHDIEQ